MAHTNRELAEIMELSLDSSLATAEDWAKLAGDLAQQLLEARVVMNAAYIRAGEILGSDRGIGL